MELGMSYPSLDVLCPSIQRRSYHPIKTFAKTEKYDGGGRIEDNVITLGGEIFPSLGSCTSESDSLRCRSDSPEIEIAAFPFFPSTFIRSSGPKNYRTSVPLSSLRRRRAIREEVSSLVRGES